MFYNIEGGVDVTAETDWTGVASSQGTPEAISNCKQQETDHPLLPGSADPSLQTCGLQNCEKTKLLL